MNIRWFSGMSIDRHGRLHIYRIGEGGKLTIRRCRNGKGCEVCWPLTERWRDFLFTVAEEFRLFWLLDKLTIFLRAIGYA